MGELKAILDTVTLSTIDLAPWIVAETVDGLKVAECLPRDLAREVVTHRLADPASTEQAISERPVGWQSA